MRFFLVIFTFFIVHTANASEHIQGIFYSPKSQKVLYSSGADESFKPASVTKIFTAYSALKVLRPDFRYQTSLAELNGKIHLDFSGDPSLTHESLTSLLSSTKAQLQDSPEQDIIIHQSHFVGPEISLGVTHDSLPMCYATPVSGIFIDHNCFKVHIGPNKIPTITALLPIKVTEKLQWVEDDSRCVFQPRWASEDHLLLSGCLKKRDEWTLSFALPMTEHRLQKIIQKQLASLGVAWTGNARISNAPLPKDAYIKSIHPSPPLSTLLKKVLVNSDNLYADALTKTMGEKIGEGSFKGGITVIQQSTGLSTLRLEDGAGTSHYNQVSAEDVLHLLKLAYDDPVAKEYLLNQLPISGVSGTLKHRLDEIPLKGKVHGKTGTLTHQFNLAGWLVNKEGDPILFSISANHNHSSSYKLILNIKDYILNVYNNSVSML